MRDRINIDNHWYFQLGDEREASEREYDHSAWRVIDVPHDWSIEADPRRDNPAGANGGFFPGGIGWYRRVIDIPADLGEKEKLIEFDGVYMNSEVYCNGNFCGKRPYGYSSFCYDITPFVNPGETAVIAVRADNSDQPNSRWYTGSGIYRHVWLTTVSPLRIGQWGVSIITETINETEASLQSTTSIINNRSETCVIELQSALISSDGSETASAASKAEIGPGEKLDMVSRLIINQPALWSPETPNLYELHTSVISNGSIIDRLTTPCGIRSIRFDADKGFFLNGENIKLKGVNEHHDAGCLGAAVPDDVVRRRFAILKEMGCNAIRIAHNPASPTFLDLCDKMGFMVVEDAFDEWKEGKTKSGYHQYWDEWWDRDLTDMIRRDRNHPSIIMWSVGNEIIEVREGKPEGLPVMEALQETCHRIDPSRPMTCGCCAIRKTNAGGYGPFMDVVGYNGGGGACFDYEKDHAAYPERILFASEVPHSLQTRGVYRTRTWYRDLASNPDVERLDVPHLTDEELFTGFDKHYQSSYDNAMVRISSIDSWRLTETLPFMCGEFRWSGFDYLGETYAWPAKSWNYGIIDLCGFPKDIFYFYKSRWTDTPMVHILPHWTWPGLEGKTIPVICYTNCDKVELFLDGASLGTQKMGDAMQLRWDVQYQPGMLKAVSYRGGSEAACARQRTASEPVSLRLSCDEDTIQADRTGIGHVAVSIVDKDGNLVPHADHDITIHVDGPAKLIGVENGDPIDTENYKLDHRKAFHGLMLAIVQARRGTGSVTVTAVAAGLRAASCALNISS
jgi:beta-galactosidase